MADPTTIAMGSMGASGAGAILKAFGSAMSGKAEAQMYQYQSGIAQFNAAVAKQNRDYASAQGEEEAVDTGLANRFVQGKVRAGLSASGVDVNSGSAKDVQISEAEIGARDVATVRNKAARVALGYATQEEQDLMQSSLYNMAAESTRAAIPLNVASNLIGGASSVSSKWLQGSSAGMFTS